MSHKLDRYQILEEIGQGGFATVYRAHDTELDRFVAVKELKPALIQDEEWIKRFLREARAIARLDHTHIITVYDVIQENNRFVIVMRLVDGPSLDKYITTHGRISWNEALTYLAGIATGLDFAHAQDVLHRDLKPANILLDPQRGPLLSDFGLAKLMGTNTSSVTVSGSIAGTPHYIAPEVWEAQPATPQTDIYALGCIAYEMLTGVKLFKGETPPAVMMAHFKPLQLPETWPDDVPPAISNVLRKALATEPTNRYSSGKELVNAMQRLAMDDEIEPAAPTPTSTLTDGEVRNLVRQVTEEIVAENKRDQAAMWQHEAENSLAEGQLDSAERAARKWQDLNPTSPALTMFWQNLAQQRKLAPTTPATTTPTPTPPPTFKEKKLKMKKGCLQKIIYAVIIILTLIGAGTVCSRCQSLESILSTVQTGPTETETIFIPKPASADVPAHLKINFSMGDLSITPGANEGLLEGQAKYNVARLKPQITTRDNTVTLAHQSTVDNFFGLPMDEFINEWDLKLSDTPLALDVRTGGSDAEIKLGGLAITDLDITQGTSSLALSFAEPNQTAMNQLFFKAGASGATVTGLANTNANEIIFFGGAGDYTLDFSGELKQNLDASIEFGLGIATLVVPQGTAATLSFDTSPPEDITVEGAWQEENGVYTMPGEGPHINITANMGHGTLNLRNK